jgi:hypothetical protein
MVALEDVIELAFTAEITGGGSATLFTVTDMLLAAEFPDVSVAIALSVCAPLATDVVFQEIL